MTEWTMKMPLVAKAQVRMLAEGVTDAAPPAASVPDDPLPRCMLTAEQIRSALPEPGGFGWRDLRVTAEGATHHELRLRGCLDQTGWRVAEIRRSQVATKPVATRLR